MRTRSSAFASSRTSTGPQRIPRRTITGLPGRSTARRRALVSPATPEKPGKAKALRTYKLTPGNAYLYNEGDLHSPRRNGPTQLIRLEGTNMDRIKRLKFEAV